MEHTSNNGDELVKVAFRLEIGEDGWPPTSVETLWAAMEGENYSLRNIPIFAQGVSWGDIIAAEIVDGQLTFQRRLRSSGYSTVRIIVSDVSDKDLVAKEIEQLGCWYETGGTPGLIAIGIPPNIDSKNIRDYLERNSTSGRLDYEESDVAWLR